LRPGAAKINLSFNFLIGKELLMTRRRRGFTLIELLVVISIIGILVGLLLPAINAAREAGRRAKCQSNMRNVVLGILGYVNNKQTFPPSGEFGEDATTNGNLTAAPPNTNPAQSVIANQFLPGATGSASRLGTPMYSWVVPILPYLDNQEMFNQWTMFGGTAANGCVSYFDPTNYVAGQASNLKISNTAIGVLICPDDNTVQNGQGNLSYVVNGGYSLYHAFPVGWVGSAVDGGGAPSAALTWASTAIGWPGTVGVTSKLGVMFPESTFGQGILTRIPWNVRSSLTGIVDGASNTILISENTLTGVSVVSTPYSNGLPTNWGCPLPNFTSFIGASNVCGGTSFTFPSVTDCTAGQLSPVGDSDGIGWSLTNKVGTFANINGGQSLTIEGSYPFSNSAHPGGCNMGFCDGGVRFISNTIDGTVYSKIITPAGSKLPLYAKQMPVEQDAFVP
jgi:prepilin-type N-terminal cleavage/methylation domain-containing protein/prepilin-type processing-associated H-X9-DG protein